MTSIPSQTTALRLPYAIFETLSYMGPEGFTFPSETCVIFKVLELATLSMQGTVRQ